MRKWGWAVLLGAGAATGMASCANKKPTTIVVAISAEGRVPEEVDQLQIDVGRAGAAPFHQAYLLDPRSQIPPGTIAVNDVDGKDPSAPVTIQVTAMKSGKPWTILRHATLGFVAEQQKLLRMPLRYSCLELDGVCAAGETCVGGVCRSPELDATSLPDFDPNLPVRVVRGQGACFDQDACLASAKMVDVAGTANSCSIDVPSGDFNVFMSWWTQPDHPVVVERDAVEGITVQGTKASFAPGLCRAIKETTFPAKTAAGGTNPVTRVTSVLVATGCAPKPADLPVCSPADTGSDGGVSDAATDAPSGHDAGPDGPNGTTKVVMTGDMSSLTVPAGDLDASGFDIQDVAKLGGSFPGGVPPLPSGVQQAGDLYQLFPHSPSQFPVPVALHIRYLLSLQGLQLYTVEEGGSTWSAVPSTVDGMFLDAMVSRFSYFVAVGNPALLDAGMDGGGGSDGGMTMDSGADDAGSDDAGMDGGAPITCSKVSCTSANDPMGVSFITYCESNCTGNTGSNVLLSCLCPTADPASCLCENGKAAPGCSTSSLAECGVPPTCSADLAKDPHNCGYCGHDCGAQKCGFGSVLECAPDSLGIGSKGAVPTSWATDGTTIYFGSGSGVYSLPVGGLPTGQEPTMLAPGSDRSIAIDGTDIYYFNDDGSVWRVPLSVGTPQVLTQGPTWYDGIFPGTHGVVLDTDNVYWAVQPASGLGSVYKMAKKGGSVQILANDANLKSGNAVDASNVYFLSYSGSDGQLRSVSKNAPGDGGTSTLMATFPGDQGLRDILAMSDGIYVAAAGGIYKIPYGATDTIGTLAWTANVVGTADAFSLATDGSKIYWPDFEGGRVWSLTPGKNDARILTIGYGEPGLILVDATNVYINEWPALYRLPKALYP